MKSFIAWVFRWIFRNELQRIRNKIDTEAEKMRNAPSRAVYDVHDARIDAYLNVLIMLDLTD